MKHLYAYHSAKDGGFSLVELSIVLVILGLLTGGILTGQSLIRAAELRSVTTEFGMLQVSANTFKQKYLAIPGDMPNATLFWGKLSAHCNGEAGTIMVNGTCNGNGNNLIEDGNAANEEGEMFLFWQHLAYANLISGRYTGLAGPNSDFDAVIGSNVYASKYPNGCYVPYYTTGGGTTRFNIDYGQGHIHLGTTLPGDDCDNALFSPENAWNIDKKIDDGKPGRGDVIARYWNNACANASANTDLDADYRLSNSTTQCSLIFLNFP